MGADKFVVEPDQVARPTIIDDERADRLGDLFRSEHFDGGERRLQPLGVMLHHGSVGDARAHGDDTNAEPFGKRLA